MSKVRQRPGEAGVSRPVIAVSDRGVPAPAGARRPLARKSVIQSTAHAGIYAYGQCVIA
jgi:hypothetical protein